MLSTPPRGASAHKGPTGRPINPTSEALACPPDTSQQTPGGPRRERRGLGPLPAGKGARPTARMLGPPHTLLVTLSRLQPSKETQGRSHSGWLPSSCTVGPLFSCWDPCTASPSEASYRLLRPKESLARPLGGRGTQAEAHPERSAASPPGRQRGPGRPASPRHRGGLTKARGRRASGVLGVPGSSPAGHLGTLPQPLDGAKTRGRGPVLFKTWPQDQQPQWRLGTGYNAGSQALLQTR